MDTIASIKTILYSEGIIFILLGLLAIALPGVATLSVEIIIGTLLIISGIVLGARAFQLRTTKEFIWSLIAAALYFVAGILFLIWPWSGVLTLTLFLAAFFFVDGVFQVVQAIKWRPNSYWGWRLFSGIVSLLLAIVIAAGLPGSAIWAIGLLLGINLFFFGIAQIAIARQVPHIDEGQSPHVEEKEGADKESAK